MTWNQRLTNLMANMERELGINNKNNSKGNGKGRQGERVARERAKGRLGGHQLRTGRGLLHPVRDVERATIRRRFATIARRSATTVARRAISKQHVETHPTHPTRRRRRLRLRRNLHGRVLHASPATKSTTRTNAEVARHDVS